MSHDSRYDPNGGRIAETQVHHSSAGYSKDMDKAISENPYAVSFD